jgi:hypothetical protein
MNGMELKKSTSQSMTSLEAWRREADSRRIALIRCLSLFRLKRNKLEI